MMLDQNAATEIESIRLQLQQALLRIRRLEEEVAALRRQVPDSR